MMMWSPLFPLRTSFAVMQTLPSSSLISFLSSSSPSSLLSLLFYYSDEEQERIKHAFRIGWWWSDPAFVMIEPCPRSQRLYQKTWNEISRREGEEIMRVILLNEVGEVIFSAARVESWSAAADREVWGSQRGREARWNSGGDGWSWDVEKERIGIKNEIK